MSTELKKTATQQIKVHAKRVITCAGLIYAGIISVNIHDNLNHNNTLFYLTFVLSSIAVCSFMCVCIGALGYVVDECPELLLPAAAVLVYKAALRFM